MLKVMSDFPYESSKTLVEIHRNGSLAEKAADAAEACWNLIGYCTFMTLDPRAPKQIALTDTKPSTDTELLALLDGFNKTHPINNPISNNNIADKLNAPFDLKHLLKWSLEFVKTLIQ